MFNYFCNIRAQSWCFICCKHILRRLLQTKYLKPLLQWQAFWTPSWISQPALTFGNVCHWFHKLQTIRYILVYAMFCYTFMNTPPQASVTMAAIWDAILDFSARVNFRQCLPLVSQTTDYKVHFGICHVLLYFYEHPTVIGFTNYRL